MCIEPQKCSKILNEKTPTVVIFFFIDKNCNIVLNLNVSKHVLHAQNRYA